MKILIINQHTKNFGDDLAGCTLINNLLTKYPECQIDLIYNTKGLLPIKDKRVHHNREITFKNIGFFSLLLYFLFGKKIINKNKILIKMIRIINSADYVFVSPCGANIGIYKDWQFLARLVMVIKEKKVPIFHLNTIGKSNSLFFNIVAKRVLKKSKVYVREVASLNYLKGIGVASIFGPDTAFSYSAGNIKKDNKIVFVPTQLSNWHPLFKKDYFDSITVNEIVKTISNFAKKNKLSVHLVPHMNSKSEKEFYNNIVASFKKNGINAKIDKVDSYKEYINKIGSARFLIGMRYHSIVSGIICSVPFVSLSYENKMTEVCNYSNMSNYSIDLYDKKYSNFKFEQILDSMLDHEQELEKKLIGELKQLSVDSMKPLEEIRW